MRFFTSVLAGGFCIFAISACAPDSSQKAVVTETKTINGKTPEDFYSDLYFKTRNECGKDIRYYRLWIEQDKAMVLKSGAEVGIRMDLMLHANHTFQIKYDETDYTGSNHMEVAARRETLYRGHWVLEGIDLIMISEGAQIGKLTFADGVFVFRSLRDFIREGLAGRDFSVGSALTPAAPIPELDICLEK